MLFCSLTKGIAPKICTLCFALINKHIWTRKWLQRRALTFAATSLPHYYFAVTSLPRYYYFCFSGPELEADLFTSVLYPTYSWVQDRICLASGVFHQFHWMDELFSVGYKTTSPRSDCPLEAGFWCWCLYFHSHTVVFWSGSFFPLCLSDFLLSCWFRMVIVLVCA